MFDLYKAKIRKLCQMSHKTQHFQIFSGVLTKNCQKMPKSAIFWCQMYSLAMLLRLLMILVPKTPKFRRELQMADFRAPKLPDFHSVARFGCGIPQNCQFGRFLPIFVQIISNISDISTHFSICTDFNLKCI